jgi:hypothetical protein
LQWLCLWFYLHVEGWRGQALEAYRDDEIARTEPATLGDGNLRAIPAGNRSSLDECGPSLGQLPASVVSRDAPEDARATDDKLNLVSAIDRNYVVPWSAMIASFRKQNPALPAHAFVIHYDLTPDDLAYIERVSRSVDVGLSIIRIPLYPFALFTTRRRTNLFTRETMSPIAYAKAFIDRFLPPELNRAVLIDADIVIAGDMSELLQMRPEFPLAAVTNIPRLHHHQFNSGFILADLEQ